MLQLKERPYNLFWMFAILLLVAGLLSPNTPLDIHLHDTYYVLPKGLLIWIPGLFLILFWLLYMATKKMLFSKTLSWIHIVLTLLTSLIIPALPYLFNSYEGLAGMPRRYYEQGRARLLNASGTQSLILVILVLALAAGQIVFLCNLLIGVYRRAKR